MVQSVLPSGMPVSWYARSFALTIVGSVLAGNLSGYEADKEEEVLNPEHGDFLGGT